VAAESTDRRVVRNRRSLLPTRLVSLMPRRAGTRSTCRTYASAQRGAVDFYSHFAAKELLVSGFDDSAR